jgi:DNA-binding transcriptional LysR family regulator
MHKDILRHDLSLLAEFRTANTFTEVGQRLGVAHTTVSRKVRDLEDHFGTRLIERQGDRVVLTAEGEKAADAAERIEGELSWLGRSISGHDDRLAGSMKLTTVDVLARRYMPALAAFRRQYPEIELTVSTEVEVRSLSRRDAEVALRMTNAPEEYLFGHVVERLEFYPYILAGAGDVPCLEQLPWLDYGSHPCASRAEQWMRKHAPGVRACTFVSTPLMMLFAIQQGLGAGMLPSAIADGEPQLRRLSDAPGFSMDVWLLAPKELRRTARVRALFSCLLES